MMKKLNLQVMILFLIMSFAITCYADKTEHWLLLDASASLSNSDVQSRNDAAWNKAATLLRANPNDVVGIAAFGCGISRKPLSPTGSSETVRRYIKVVGNKEQCTDIEEALKKVLQRVQNFGVKTTVYLFTDGRVDVPPQLSSSSGRDTQDDASEKRIISKIIPTLSEKEVIVNVIALPNKSLDKDARSLLKKLSSGTTGQYNISVAKKLLSDWSTSDRHGLQAKIEDGGYINLDKRYADRHDLLIPSNARVEHRDGDVEIEHFALRDGTRVEIDLHSDQGRIQVVDQNNQGVSKKDIVINTTSKIIAEPFSPLLNKMNFYQNEVVLFKMKLKPNLNLGSQEIFETIQSKVRPLVKISGACRGVVTLKDQKEDGQGENRGMTFQRDWWITKCNFKGKRPGSFSYEFVVKDNSNQMSYYEVVIPSAFSGYSIVKLPPALGQWNFNNSAGGSNVFKNLADDTYYTGGNLEINFKYSFNNMTIANEGQRLLPWEPGKAMYFMDGVKLEGNSYHLTDSDIGEKILTCIYHATESGSLNQVKLKFQKTISIAKGPFSLQPEKESLGTKTSNKKEFDIPFNITVNKDTSLAVDLKSGKLPLTISEDSKWINLKKGQDGIKNIKVIAEKNLPKGRYDITITFSNSKILKKPLNYKVSLKIVPYWWFVVIGVIILLICIYLSLLFYWTIWWNYKTSENRKTPWAKKINEGTSEEIIFKLKLLLPGRQFKIFNTSNKHIYTVKVKFLGGIKIIPADSTYNILIEQIDHSRKHRHLKHIHLADSKVHGGSHSIQFAVRINPGKNDPEVRKIVKKNPELRSAMQQNRFLRR